MILTDEEIRTAWASCLSESEFIVRVGVLLEAQALKCQQEIADLQDNCKAYERLLLTKDQAIQKAKKEGFILGRATTIPVDLLNKPEIEELNKQADAFCDGLKKEGMRESVERDYNTTYTSLYADYEAKCAALDDSNKKRS